MGQPCGRGFEWEFEPGGLLNIEKTKWCEFVGTTVVEFAGVIMRMFQLWFFRGVMALSNIEDEDIHYHF